MFQRILGSIYFFILFFLFILAVVILIAATSHPATTPPAEAAVVTLGRGVAARERQAAASALPVVNRDTTPRAAEWPVAVEFVEPQIARVATRALPTFTDASLRPGIERVAYITDTCQALALQNRPGGAAPGTIVLPLMFHGIFPSLGADDLPGKNITIDDFNGVLTAAHELGFETITTEQLIGFLYRNEYVPQRSLYIIFDDRYADEVIEHALPKMKEYGWTAVLAWISDGTTPREWAKVQTLLDSGHFELQSHGFAHQYVRAETPELVLRDELYGPIHEYQNRFGFRPRAHIWPGGHSTPRAVEIADEAGYELGFSVFPRGPLMFNSIPLGAEERATAHPLLVLPRTWPTFGIGEFRAKLERALTLSAEAAAFAESTRPAAMARLNQSCNIRFDTMASNSHQ